MTPSTDRRPSERRSLPLLAVVALATLSGSVSATTHRACTGLFTPYCGIINGMSRPNWLNRMDGTVDAGTQERGPPLLSRRDTSEAMLRLLQLAKKVLDVPNSELPDTLLLHDSTTDPTGPISPQAAREWLRDQEAAEGKTADAPAGGMGAANAPGSLRQSDAPGPLPSSLGDGSKLLASLRFVVGAHGGDGRRRLVGVDCHVSGRHTQGGFGEQQNNPFSSLPGAAHSVEVELEVDETDAGGDGALIRSAAERVMGMVQGEIHPEWDELAPLKSLKRVIVEGQLPDETEGG